MVAAPTGGLGETVRLDSSELKTTQDDPEVTRVISRNTDDETGDFDPYKTIMARPPQTSADLSLTTGDLMPASIPPTPRPANIPPAAPPPPPSQPSQPSAPLNSPPPDSSSDIGQLTLASFAPPPPPPSSGQLSASLPPPPPPQMPPPAAAPRPAAGAAATVTPQKKSKLPLILGLLVVLLFLGAGGAAAAYFFVVKPMLEKRNDVTNDRPPVEPSPQVANTPSESPQPGADKKEVPPYNPPADAVQFVNSKERLDGKLAEHYVDFSFYYPQRWVKDPKAGVAGASNFAKVERRLPPDFTQENFAVGWYSSAGSEEGDRAAFPGLAANLSAQFAKGFTEYKKVSEGATKAGPYDGYEFRFESVSRNTERGDIQIWGRVIFLPPTDGGKSGVTLLMLATSLAPELKSVDDVGVKGDLPMMLESFRFGK